MVIGLRVAPTALVLICLSSAIRAESSRAVVEIDSGRLGGLMLEDGIRVFKGIPYAAPPIGPLRWRPPQPVTPWEGVRDATAFGPICPQPEPMIGRLERSVSEDCLTLNVWTPARTAGEALPVMVWIHGGGFTTGAGSQSVYDGVPLARDGVLLVTLNYRLGPFGFLAHPLLSKESPRGVSGNYGLLDQIAALKWVQRNIAAFGGDPDRVTIFGESAGAVSVCLHLVSPLSEGFFHRAIAESGAARGRYRHLRERWYGMESMEQVGMNVATELGCAGAEDPLAALRQAPADRVLEAARPAQGLFGRGNKFGPCVDGWVLPDDPGEMLRGGRQHPVPVITGCNANEGTIFLQQLAIRNAAAYRLLMQALFGADAEALLQRFPVETDGDLQATLDRLITVSTFETTSRALARDISAGNAKSFLYHFTRRPGAPWLARLGSFHSFEIFHVFGNLDRRLRFDRDDETLSRKIRAYWTTFASTGDPNRDDLPRWPAYEDDKGLCLELGLEIRQQPAPDAEICDIIDPIQERKMRERRETRRPPWRRN